MNRFGDCLTCKSFSKSAFSCLATDVISKQVVGNSVSINFKKGQDVYSEGTLAKGVYCIQSGKVKIFKKCSARNITYSVAGNSDLIGYQAFFNGNTFTNSVKCFEDSQICFIPKKIFLNILSSNHDLAMYLLKKLSEENNKLANFARDLKCRNTLNRIISALLYIHDKFGTDENECLNVTLTRKDFSEIAGTTTESAIRVLNDLKKERTISFYNNRIRISDATKLTNYLKFEVAH